MTEFKRNLKTLNNKTGKKIITKLNEMMSDHEKYKKSYFWTPSGNATSRRNQEFENEIIFTLNGTKYEWQQDLKLSCKNVYWVSVIYKNDKKSNITTIKKILGV